jgi:hypothetical protein
MEWVGLLALFLFLRLAPLEEGREEGREEDLEEGLELGLDVEAVKEDEPLPRETGRDDERDPGRDAERELGLEEERECGLVIS